MNEDTNEFIKKSKLSNNDRDLTIEYVRKEESINTELLRNPKKIEALILKGNNLRELPEEVFKLPNLKKLDLTANDLTELPESIGNLTRLEELCLNANPLRSLPENIVDLKNTIIKVGQHNFHKIGNNYLVNGNTVLCSYKPIKVINVLDNTNIEAYINACHYSPYIINEETAIKAFNTLNNTILTPNKYDELLIQLIKQSPTLLTMYKTFANEKFIKQFNKYL